MNERWVVFDLIGVLAEPSWRDIARDPSLSSWGEFKLGRKDEASFWDAEQRALYRRLLAFRRDRLELVRNLKSRGYKVCVATNFSRDWLDHLKQKSGVGSLFDAEVVSAEVHAAKPDREFWQALLAKVPKASVFVDDREENCVAAQQAGLRAIWAHPACPVDLEVEELLHGS